ncbi:DMT family transporter [Elioraea sp.]|uniref:DMT family transporter n=1 Tax=Elioraea sp. TaxID=2185103 RepID=UPI00345A7105
MGFALCGAAMVTVGSTVVASKVIGAGMPPFTAAALRFAIALPVFLLLLRLAGEGLPRPSVRDGALLVTQAALGSVGYMLLLVIGLRFTAAADAGVVAGSLTAMVALLAWALLRERPSRLQMSAIALASGGVALVTAGSEGRTLRVDGAALLGNLLVLAAVACEAAFLLLNKRLRVPVAPLALSTTMTGLGLALAVPFALLERPWQVEMSHAALLAVVWYAVVPTVGGFLLWYAGARRLSGAQAALTTAVLPVSAVALAASVLGEAVSLVQGFGMLCVLAAVMLGALPDRQR